MTGTHRYQVPQRGVGSSDEFGAGVVAAGSPEDTTSGHRMGFQHLHVKAPANEMVRSGQSSQTGTDHTITSKYLDSARMLPLVSTTPREALDRPGG